MAFVGSLTAALASARHRAEASRQRLNSAAERLELLTDAVPADDEGRSAIAWGYAERLRLGLESPFRLIEAAARDPRLHADERRTVSWALLARVLRGQSLEIDPAVLDAIDVDSRAPGDGERHLRLIEGTVRGTDNPRAAELALRLAYTLAGTERLVDGSAAQLVANVAALVADRELARREAANVVRAARRDPIDEVRSRRARHAFYVERPTLLMTDHDVEHEALRLVPVLLDSLRAPHAIRLNADSVRVRDSSDAALAKRLYTAGARAAPVAPLAVTVKRYLPLIRGQAHMNVADIGRSWNGEMLVAATSVTRADRGTRRVLGRLLVSSAVAMRSLAQQALWFPGDSAPTAAQVATTLGVSAIRFDHDVPAAWRPDFLLQLSSGVMELRKVFPALDLQSLTIRFRMRSPVDSALAMHDPRTRTLHLPVFTAAGTLTHELAHDLDRQAAARERHPGYRTDYVARHTSRLDGNGASNRVASALQALTEESADALRPARRLERPAEIFATRVDWFVAQALASRRLSSGFLTGVQDEMLTGHVVHPERLRSSGRTRSLIVALQGMTAVAPFAAREDVPSVQALLRWALSAPVDRDVAAEVLRGHPDAWRPVRLTADASCEVHDERASLVRMAADSRARGWVRRRARWMAEARRPPWARAALEQGPWNAQAFESRVAELRDHILTELAAMPALGAGLPAYAAPMAQRAGCG